MGLESIPPGIGRPCWLGGNSIGPDGGAGGSFGSLRVLCQYTSAITTTITTMTIAATAGEISFFIRCVLL
jgi:hypothetical protein